MIIRLILIYEEYPYLSTKRLSIESYRDRLAGLKVH